MFGFDRHTLRPDRNTGTLPAVWTNVIMKMRRSIMRNKGKRLQSANLVFIPPKAEN